MLHSINQDGRRASRVYPHVQGEIRRERVRLVSTFALMVSLVGIGLAAAGCSPARNSVSQAGFAELSAVTNERLPDGIAGAPINLQIPPKDNLAVLMAVHSGDTVTVQANSRWHGTTVTLYYLPSSNLRHDGTHFYLMGAKNVQRVGQFPIEKSGKWKATWHVGNYKVHPHSPLFMLAVSDAREMALVRMNTKN